MDSLNIPLALAVVLSFVLIPSRMAAQETNLRPVTLHVGFTRSSFRNVNAADATAALRIFAQTTALKRGWQMTADARLFESSADCANEIKNGHINLAILDTWDYLSMDIQSKMTPIFVSLEQGAIFGEYLLLIHRDGGVSGLADLKGKNIMALEGNGGDLSRAWLDWLLRANHLEPKETFFAKLEPVTKPVSAVLPVFFGAKSACLVDRAAFQDMSRLNPQVGSNLVSVAVSEPYLENMLCISKSGWASDQVRLDVISSIAELHSEPSGRQVLSLFNLEQLAPFKDEYLDTVRKLRRDLASAPDGQTKQSP
jgi:phosphonate transport system substrate-binding protein